MKIEIVEYHCDKCETLISETPWRSLQLQRRFFGGKEFCSERCARHYWDDLINDMVRVSPVAFTEAHVEEVA